MSKYEHISWYECYLVMDRTQKHKQNNFTKWSVTHTPAQTVFQYYIHTLSIMLFLIMISQHNYNNVKIYIIIYNILSGRVKGHYRAPCTIYCLLFAVKRFYVFCRLLCNCKSSLANFWLWVLRNLAKAGNHKHFLGMKVKTWTSKSFSLRIISNVWYLTLPCH